MADALSVVYGIDIAIRSALAPRHLHYALTHPLALIAVVIPPVRVIFSIRLVRSMFRRGHLARSYSWISPPRTLSRRILAAVMSVVVAMDLSTGLSLRGQVRSSPDSSHPALRMGTVAVLGGIWEIAFRQGLALRARRWRNGGGRYHHQPNYVAPGSVQGMACVLSLS